MPALLLTLLLLLFAACSNEQQSYTKVSPDAHKVKKITDTTPQSTPKSIKRVLAPKSATELFKQCQACHGLKAEKAAMNRSAIIKNWSALRIKEALLGYKKGSYGGALKSVMQAQIKMLSRQELEALAEYISKL